MAYVAMATNWVYRKLITYQDLNRLGANDAYLKDKVENVSTGHVHSGAAGEGKKIPKLWLDNDGLQIADTNASHNLIIKPGSDLTADRILTITTGDAARTLTIEADSLINQDLTSDAAPTFLKLTLSQTTGTAPLTIASTTVVANLNADLWDGYQFADYLNQAVKTTSKPTHAGIILTAASSIAASVLFSFEGDGGNTGISADGSDNLALWTAGSIKLYVSAAGDVSILATKKILFDGSTGHTYILESGDGLLDFYANATHLLRLSTGGILIALTGSAASTDVTFNTGTNAFTYVTSSLRYKENIKPAESMLDRVLQLKPSRYDRKDGSTKNELGLIAEEVYPLFPEIVPLNNEGQPESVSYSRLSIILLKAIQELKGELDDFKRTAWESGKKV